MAKAMKYRYTANIITGFRVFLSFLLLFCQPLSTIFYFLYLIAGVTDMIDGRVARKTNTACKFGSKFDSAADFLFVIVCFIRLLPILDIPIWIYIWTVLIAAIRIIDIILKTVIYKKPEAVHTTADKFCGFMLFILPFTLKHVDAKYSAPIVCAFAMIASFYNIRQHTKKERND